MRNSLECLLGVPGEECTRVFIATVDIVLTTMWMSEIVVGELESRRMGFTQSPHMVHQRGGVVSFPSLLGAPSSLQTLTDLACANMYSAVAAYHIWSSSMCERWSCPGVLTWVGLGSISRDSSR